MLELDTLQVAPKMFWGGHRCNHSQVAELLVDEYGNSCFGIFWSGAMVLPVPVTRQIVFNASVIAFADLSFSYDKHVRLVRPEYRGDVIQACLESTNVDCLNF